LTSDLFGGSTMTRQHFLPAALGTLLLVAFLFALSPLSAHAQGTSATLNGTIQDTQGGVIPGVQVTVENPATTFRRETTTNSEGYFTVPLLQPGTYLVTARRDGFAPVQYKDVVLNVGDQKALNIQLKAGDVNATVTVDSSAETIRTDGSVGTVINRNQVANMPLNGRSFHALIQLVPGVVLTGNTGGVASGAQFSVNGQRTTSNYFTVDGVGANTGMEASFGNFPDASGSGQTVGTTALGGTNSLISLDALQEFRIETSSYAAEFGRTPGGQISLVSRSGQNRFHGSAFEYFRNEALDANDWFANRAGLRRARERQNFFGGVFGGPIKKDRVFFFTSYEALRLQQPVASVANVPTVAIRQQALPFVRPYLNALPLPNGRDFGNGLGEFTAAYSNPGSFDIFSIRIDGKINSKLTSLFRLNHAPSETLVRRDSLSTVQTTQIRDDSYTGGVTWLASRQLIADVRVNWTRNQPRVFLDLDNFGGAVVPQISDVFAPGRNPSKEALVFSGGSSFSGFIWGQGSSDTQRQTNIVGSLSWLRGNHQLKLGLDYLRMVPQFGTTGGSFESLLFSSIQQLRPPSTTASNYQITNSDTEGRSAVIQSLSLFAQDTWQVNKRLTLTLGLRFERVPSPGESTGKLPRVVAGIDVDPLPSAVHLAPPSTPILNNRFGSFAPRVGAAYQLGRKAGWETTLRGGAGVFYDLLFGRIPNAFQQIYPFFASVSTSNAPLPLSSVLRTPPVLGVDPPQQFWQLDPNIQLPYTIQWNATWEQGIGQNQNASLAYVGAAGRRLLVTQPYFPTFTEWSRGVSVFVNRNRSESSYKALQAQYRRRLSRRLEGLISYTLARSRDNSSSNLSSPPVSGGPAIFALEWGPSDFDVRHVASASASYNLPKVPGSTVIQMLSKDWALDVLFRYQSAFPYTPTSGTLLFGGVSFTRRADRISDQPLYIEDPAAPGGRRANRGAFTPAAAGTQGNFPRNGLRAFPASQVDLAVRREFRLRESVKLQLRAELFNIFNHPNFGPPTRVITSATFGQPTSMLSRSLGGLNALYQMGGPRSAQLSLRVIF
jgi:hypothetical protein